MYHIPYFFVQLIGKYINFKKNILISKKIKYSIILKLYKILKEIKYYIYLILMYLFENLFKKILSYKFI